MDFSVLRAMKIFAKSCIQSPNEQFSILLKLLKDKRLTTPIFTHFEIQASWSYFSVLSLTGVKRNDYILPEIMSRPSKVAFMSFKRGFSEFRQ